MSLALDVDEVQFAVANFMAWQLQERDG